VHHLVILSSCHLVKMMHPHMSTERGRKGARAWARESCIASRLFMLQLSQHCCCTHRGHEKVASRLASACCSCCSTARCSIHRAQNNTAVTLQVAATQLYVAATQLYVAARKRGQGKRGVRREMCIQSIQSIIMPCAPALQASPIVG